MSVPASEKIPLIFLAGGFGTRLRSVSTDVPKPMVTVSEKPFLHWLVQSYYDQGFRDFIFSTGYKAEVIESYAWAQFFPKAQVRFYREETPLGTGGAVAAIFKHFHLTRAWVINGDTLLEEPLPTLDTLPLNKFGAIYMALQPKAVFDAVPNLKVEGQAVVGESAPADYLDAGALFVDEKALDLKGVGKPPFSIHALLNMAMNQRKVGYWVLNGTCYDMGTPERLKRLEGYLRRL